MVLLGSARYAEEHALLQRFIAKRGMSETYGDLVTLLDQPEQVVTFIEDHPPREQPRRPALYELL
jgi:hypothetical protein